MVYAKTNISSITRRIRTNCLLTPSRFCRIKAPTTPRVRTSAKLFDPFSVELLIFGDKFCVAIYDRRGVELSPEHNMRNDTFLRVVRSLTCQLDERRLGLDETVEHHFKLKGDRKQHDEYFVIQPIGDDTHYWETVGWSPIWRSLSMFGRVTEVWMFNIETGESCIGSSQTVTKIAWRNGTCLLQSHQRYPEDKKPRWSACCCPVYVWQQCLRSRRFIS